MDKEYKALIDHGTWEVVPVPVNMNIVGNRWVFVWKRDQQGEIHCARSRLVSQGFTQAFGVDYNEMYSPVTRLASLRVICAIVARNDWPIHQMDVDSAYLNEELPDPIYMKQLRGYEKGDKDHVLLLKRALYGLKQLGREWHKHLSNKLFKPGFIKSRSDAAIFYRRGSKGHVIVAAAVDDLTITAESQTIVDGIKRDLNKVFKMKDLGKIHWFLNLKFERDWNAK
jgi:Reverse transcriptase (RNA-dependent DNA polymerase)